ncbi:hypothetical protein [Spirosoma horti]
MWLFKLLGFATILTLSGSLPAQSQSKLDSFLAGLDSNNVYLRTGRLWVDSCRTAQKEMVPVTTKRRSTQAPPGKLTRQALVRLESSYQQLHQTIYRQAILTYLQLIYQRKRLDELTHRQELLGELTEAISWRKLKAPSNQNEQAVQGLLLELQEKCGQKKAIVNQLQQELAALNGQQVVNLPSTAYPALPSTKVLIRKGAMFPVYKLWYSRYVLLRRALALNTRILQNRPSLSRLTSDLKTGQLMQANFMDQFINVSSLIDCHMRTERDLYLAAAYFTESRQRSLR